MTSAVELIVDELQVTERALAFPDQARALRIVDAASYERACEFLKAIKALRTEIADTFDPHIRRAYEAHRALCKEKNGAEAPLATAERITKDALNVWDQEQERRRQAEAKRLQEQLRQDEEERRLLEAIELEEAAKATGDTSLAMEAEVLLETPITVPTVAVAPATPKVSGIAYRETWSAKVVNLHDLVKFVAANPQFIGLLQPNATSLNAQARSLKASMRLPGVEAVCVRDVAAGRR